jgi:hypothetical protein
MLIPALALLTLAGCSEPPVAPQDLEGLERELAAATAANTRDPAITAALADPIMVDPGLAQSANAHTIRPAPHPVSGLVPVEAPLPPDPVPAMRAPAAMTDCPDCAARRGTLTIGALAERQRNATIAACARRIGYSALWAERLPGSIPLYPAARVREAAGNDANGCALRVVSFATAAPPAKVIAFYHARATRAGFSGAVQTQGPMQVIGGTRDQAAYAIYAAPRPGGGSTVDLVVNGG